MREICENCEERIAEYKFRVNTLMTVKKYCSKCCEHSKDRLIDFFEKSLIHPYDQETKELLENWIADNEEKHYKKEMEKAIKKTKKQEEKWEEAKEKIETLLSALIGMNDVKNTIRGWVSRLQGGEKLRAKTSLKLEKSTFHMTITGSSGVGKSEIARIIAQVLYILKIVEKDDLVEVNKDDFIGTHVGSTAPKTQRVIDSAIGGVLFIDEAHALSSKSTKGEKADFGEEAIQTLMAAMDKNKENTVFIYAGYPIEIEDFLQSNQGLASRIPLSLHINDYTPNEIAQMMIAKLQKQGFETQEAEEQIHQLVMTKSKKGIIPGNGRTAANYADQIVANFMKRVQVDAEEINVRIYAEDVESLRIKKRTPEDEEGLSQVKEAALRKLNSLTGLHQIKTQIKKIGSYEYVQRKKEEQGLPTNKSSLHMTFNGDPGSGKTTVARILGEYFRGLGILSRGHFTELSKADLVKGNQPTSSTVKNIVKEAIGGVLFIDEAYALAREKQGMEALDSLIKEMEDHREDLIVILAGYTSEMEHLYDVNPGLRSRIAYPLEFENYSADELITMLNDLLNSQEMKLTKEAADLLITKVEEFHQNDWVEANGRWVRNLFEKMMMNQSLRVVEAYSTDYTTIEKQDVENSFNELGQPREKGTGPLEETLSEIKEMMEKVKMGSR